MAINTTMGVRRLLLVEDSHSDAELLQAALETAGAEWFDIQRVETVAEALAALAAQPCDLVLLDLSLPDSQGMKTIEQVSAAAREVPIVVLSGATDEAVALEAVAHGAQDYLTKGKADGQAIIRAIRYAVDRKHQQVSLERARDELDRKVVERTAELQRLNQTLRILNACNETLLRLSDEQALLQEICRIIVEIGGYRAAWVGYARSDPAKTIRPMASLGFKDGSAGGAGGSWADNQAGQSPAGSAIRTGKVQVSRNFAGDQRPAAWQEEAMKRGCRALAALPLNGRSKTIGVLVIYAGEPEAFGPAEIELLGRLAENLAFGIAMLQTRAEHGMMLKALEDAQQQLRVVVDSAPIVLWATDRQGRLTLIEGRLGLLGPESARVLGRPVEEVAELAPMRHEIREHLRRALEGEDSFAELACAGRVYSARYSPIRTRPGEISGVLCVMTDTTDRRRAQQQLRMVIDSAPVVLWAVDTDYRFTLMEGRLKPLGLVTRRLVGRSMPEAMSDHPEIEASIRRAMMGEESTVEMPFRGRLYVSRYAPLRDAAGQIAGAICASTDITESRRAKGLLRESEARYRSLFDDAPVGIGLTELDGAVITANRALEELSGYRLEELQARTGAPLWGDPESSGLVLKLLHSGAGVRGLELQLTRQDGTTFPALIDAHPTTLEGRQVLLVIVRDNSANYMLDRAAIEASQSEQQRIGHDLHDTIVGNLVGIAKVAEALKAALVGTAAGPLELAAQAEQISQAVRRTLSQTRGLARGLCPLMLTPDGLMVALRDLAAQTGPLFNKECRFECPRPVLVHDSAVAGQLYYIGQEAINNAVRHSQGRTIIVQLVGHDDAIELSVTDDGVGLPPETTGRDCQGLRAMAHRARMIGAALSIRPGQPRGTVVECRLRNPAAAAK